MPIDLKISVDALKELENVANAAEAMFPKGVVTVRHDGKPYLLYKGLPVVYLKLGDALSCVGFNMKLFENPQTRGGEIRKQILLGAELLFKAAEEQKAERNSADQREALAREKFEKLPSDSLIN